MLCALLTSVVHAQSFGGAFNRENEPLLPSNGNWWNPDTGDGRWGLQIEVQTGTFFPQGFLGSAIFSYNSDDPSQATWYSISQPYEYNPNWRQDGYIGQMELTLNQSSNGICLRCEDGSASGMPILSDVDSARIIFRDSMNAELQVGNITHQLIKSQWGDGVEASLDEFWQRTFRFNVEATFLDTRINGAGLITPTRAADQVNYEGISGWDVFNYTIFVVAETISTGGQVEIPQNFQLLAHKETNQYRVIYPSLTAMPHLEYKLFPQNRNLVEGRLLRSVGFPAGEDVFGNVLFMTTPSLQTVNGQPRPWY